MSNFDLKMVQMLVPVAKYGVKCPYAMVPEFLTIHNTANDASALAEISFMIGNGDEVSYHWAVRRAGTGDRTAYRLPTSCLWGRR